MADISKLYDDLTTLVESEYKSIAKQYIQKFGTSLALAEYDDDEEQYMDMVSVIRDGDDGAHQTTEIRLISVDLEDGDCCITVTQYWDDDNYEMVDLGEDSNLEVGLRGCWNIAPMISIINIMRMKLGLPTV
ncbi:MAG: hypothetical protein ACOX5T_06750 [Candidatus Cryptobacteroides sp.]|jgi:hypothetical protein